MATEPRTFVYSSIDEPRLLRPALPGEVHIWLLPSGERRQLLSGVWKKID